MTQQHPPIASTLLHRSPALRGADLLLRLSVGGLLVYSGYEKLRDPTALVLTMDAYRLLGSTGGLILAIVLPWLEIIAGTCLIARVATGGAAVVATLLGLMFVIAQVTAVARGLNIHCGCFGDPAAPVGAGTIARACGLLAASVATLALQNRRDASPLLTSDPSAKPMSS